MRVDGGPFGVRRFLHGVELCVSGREGHETLMSKLLL